jgi:hypothetical protein
VHYWRITYRNIVLIYLILLSLTCEVSRAVMRLKRLRGLRLLPKVTQLVEMAEQTPSSQFHFVSYSVFVLYSAWPLTKKYTE